MISKPIIYNLVLKKNLQLSSIFIFVDCCYLTMRGTFKEFIFGKGYIYA